jgi:import receptor subunit TOM20
MTDMEAVQKFFMQELELGEELLQSGDIENGIFHLSNAVVVCGSPQQLLAVMQQTLPAPVFQLLLSQLPSASAVSPMTL